MQFEPFMFMPGMTIEAAIRLKNNYVHGDTLKNLVAIFNEKNGLRAPRPGENFLIPILSENEN